MANHDDVLSDLPTFVVDQKARTVRELLEHTPFGEGFIRRFIKEQLRSGKWERVHKRVDGQLRPAYRRRLKKG